jgi:Nitrile hydratase, alpha chain
MAESLVHLERWNKIVSKAGQDNDFRKRLLADPAAVLKENGVQVPPGLEFRVVENTAGVANLVLPAGVPVAATEQEPGGALIAAADPSSAELSDEELEQVSGGLTSVCYVPPQRY